MNLPLQPSAISGPLLVIAIAVMVFLMEPASSSLLAFDRDRINDGEVWRFISGNFAHGNLSHLLLNLFGLILLWALHGQHYRQHIYAVVFISCCLGCTLGIYLFDSNLMWYVGLSGALHGLLVWGSVQDIRSGLRSGWLLLTGVWAKIAYEQIFGPSTDVEDMIGLNVAVGSHLFGAITGMLIVVAYWTHRQLGFNEPSSESS